ncbi:MAG: hypothetical protein AB7Q97_25045 [Gammaproteobacteria bacterium]
MARISKLAAQQAAHKFFTERLLTLEPFTQDDVARATGWSTGTLSTYWSKQFRGFLEPLHDGRFRVKENFRSHLDWKRFRVLVTQVTSIGAEYKSSVFENVIVYEFYMPLAHEQALRTTLDSLFYTDAVLPRLKRIGLNELEKRFERSAIESDDDFYSQVLDYVNCKFVGYSIYHVDGRFRGFPLSSREEALHRHRSGGQYLVDETTAIARFIFPCNETDPDRVRFLFQELFINAITPLVGGEDEIWIVETGMRNCVHVWKPSVGNQS